MEQRLLDDWRFYCKELMSPQSFIDMAFYSLIGAALQRKVWLTSTEMPIFPNTFTALVGPPATGKGLVLSPIRDIIGGILRNPNAKKPGETQTKEEVTDKILESATEEDLLAMAQNLARSHSNSLKYKPDYDPPRLIPLAATATTYESLVEENAKSIRSIKTDLKCSLVPASGIYTHNSLCFTLEELEALINDDTKKIVPFLTEAWDCREYTYKTKGGGTDRIKRPCLTMLAGTNFDFLKDCRKSRLIGGGFTSRIIFVCEKKPRFAKFSIPAHTFEQIEAKKRIIARVEHLGRNVFGQVNWSLEAWDYLSHFYEQVQPKNKANTDPVLDYYYGRKNVHIQKLALAIHFADSDSMELNIFEAKEALRILEELELKMHLALETPDPDNPVSKLSRRIKELLESGPKSVKDIYIKLEANPAYDDTMTFLEKAGYVEKYEQNTQDGKTTKMIKLV